MQLVSSELRDGVKSFVAGSLRHLNSSLLLTVVGLSRCFSRFFFELGHKKMIIGVP